MNSLARSAGLRKGTTGRRVIPSNPTEPLGANPKDTAARCPAAVAAGPNRQAARSHSSIWDFSAPNRVNGTPSGNPAQDEAPQRRARGSPHAPEEGEPLWEQFHGYGYGYGYGYGFGRPVAERGLERIERLERLERIAMFIHVFTRLYMFLHCF